MRNRKGTKKLKKVHKGMKVMKEKGETENSKDKGKIRSGKGGKIGRKN